MKYADPAVEIAQEHWGGGGMVAFPLWKKRNNVPGD